MNKEEKHYKKQLEKHKYIQTEIMRNLDTKLGIDSISQGAFIGGAELEKYFEQNFKDKQMEVEEQIKQYIESRIKEYKDRAQEVEGLVLLWAQKLKRLKVEEELFLKTKIAYEHTKRTSEVRHAIFQSLEREYHQHFKISVLREGNTEW